MTRAMTEVERFTADPDNMRLFQQERAIFETTELICRMMEESGVNKAELARRLGKSPAYVTQLLDGRTNMTLRTISDVLWTLDSSLHISCGALSTSATSPTDVQFGATEATLTSSPRPGEELTSWLSSFRHWMPHQTGPDMLQVDSLSGVWLEAAGLARGLGYGVGAVGAVVPSGRGCKATLKLVA